MDDDMRCQYQSANCESARSLKNNGELHGLCAFHRDKANKTQRRWHSRQKDSPGGTPTVSTTSCSLERRAIARLSSASTRMVAKALRAEKRRQAEVIFEPRGPTYRHRQRPSVGKGREAASDSVGMAMDDDDLHLLMTLVLEHDRMSRLSEKPAREEYPEFAKMLDEWGGF